MSYLYITWKKTDEKTAKSLTAEKLSEIYVEDMFDAKMLAIYFFPKWG